MKLKIESSKFIDGLKTVQNIVPGKGSLPIIQNVLIEAAGDTVRFTTTDLDITITSTVKCEVKEEGRTTLPVKQLFESMIKAPECMVEVSVDEDDKAIVKAGSSRLRLNGKSANEFPPMEAEGECINYTLPCPILLDMLRKTSYAASQDDTRRTLKGVLASFKTGKLTMVATDGRRLAMVEQEMDIAGNCENDIVLPSKTVQELQRSLSGNGNVTLKVQPSRISVEFDNIRIYSKLMAEKYPNYNQVIPTDINEKITIERQPLIEALERASVMTMDAAHSTRLAFSDNMLTVSSASSDIGDAKDEVPIKYAGENVEIIFNPDYVLDALKAIDDDQVTLCLKNGHSPAVIRCSIPFLYVLMPLRIN